MRHTLLTACMAVSVVLLLGGCATRTVGVVAQVYPDAPRKPAGGYSVHVVDNREGPDPIVDAYIAERIREQLRVRGVQIESQDTADLYLVYGYSLGKGRAVTRRVRVKEKDRTIELDTWGYGADGLFMSNTTVKVPGETRYETRVSQRYDSTLRMRLLDANDLRGRGDQTTVWFAEATNTQRSANLRSAGYMLVYAAMTRLGSGSGERVEVEFNRKGAVLAKEQTGQLQAGQGVAAALLLGAVAFVTIKYIQAGGGVDELPWFE